jgi:hypothetical protein
VVLVAENRITVPARPLVSLLSFTVLVEFFISCCDTTIILLVLDVIVKHPLHCCFSVSKEYDEYYGH